MPETGIWRGNFPYCSDDAARRDSSFGASVSTKTANFWSMIHLLTGRSARSAHFSACSTHFGAPTFIISPQVLSAQASAPDIFLSSPPDGKRHQHPVKKTVAASFRVDLAGPAEVPRGLGTPIPVKPISDVQRPFCGFRCT